jgi:hypothetical protein
MDFINEMWVICPRCSQCAIIRNRDFRSTDQFAPRRLVCTKCPHVADWDGREMAFWHSKPADPFFGYELWLRESCCGDTLWAYNPTHLQFLSDFVGATERKRSRNEDYGWSNKSLASRLPKWMQSAKNRKAVLKSIRKLELKIEMIEEGAQPDTFGAG